MEVFVDPSYQGMRLGRRLYDARKEHAENLNLKGILPGRRIPSYYKHSDELSSEQIHFKGKKSGTARPGSHIPALK
ncbi:MAG: GNAT family N-acetyltransferase [Desulfobulbaceae bacterium]|nr:GNAT family N-acetyltransferase [Desulfobulbaceae bacterium]